MSHFHGFGDKLFKCRQCCIRRLNVLEQRHKIIMN